MRSPYTEFCLKYKEKLRKDKEIEQFKLDPMDDYRERINFGLNLYSFYPMHYKVGDYGGTQFFMLDNEDLEYLYNKYSKLLQSEMDEEIKQI